MACASRSRAVQLWKAEFILHLQETPQKYCERWKSRFVQGPDSDKLRMFARWLPYLGIHATFYRVRADFPDLRVVMFPAEETAYKWMLFEPDPLLVALLGVSDEERSTDQTGSPMFAMGRSPSLDPGPPPIDGFVKLRGLERNAWTAIRWFGAYHNDSPLREMLDLPELPGWWPVTLATYVGGCLTIRCRPVRFFQVAGPWFQLAAVLAVIAPAAGLVVVARRSRRPRDLKTL